MKERTSIFLFFFFPSKIVISLFVGTGSLVVMNVSLIVYLHLFLQDISTLCDQLQALVAIILSNNLLSCEISGPLQLKHIRILVLNNTGITWMQVSIVERGDTFLFLPMSLVYLKCNFI